MLAEEPADHVVLVADPLRHLAAEVQKQPRVLQTAGAEAENLGLYREPPHLRRIGGEDRLGHAAQIVAQAQVHQIGVEKKADAVGSGDLVVVLLAEVRRRAAEAEKHVAEVVALLGDRQVGKSRRRGEVEDGVRLPLVGIEVGLLDRPAAEGGKGVRAEVVGVELAAPAAPVVRGAAEVAQPRHVEGIVVETGDLACVEVLGVGGELEPPRLHQRHAEALGGQAPRDGDARRPRADHAGVEAAFEQVTPGGGRIEDHGVREVLVRGEIGDCDGERILGVLHRDRAVPPSRQGQI
jgi:hypothetical protein